MSQTLIFHNPGEIDIRGACIAGLSAKESKSPIGYFGTGLKYAIASILRWGGEVVIYSGTARYRFSPAALTFREKEFHQVLMWGPDEQPKELGFTTEYGKDWKAWQVFRELYANARDEGGDVWLREDIAGMYAGGLTHIVITGVPDLISTYYQRDEIILPPDKVWTQQDKTLQFTPSPAEGLYYRGVRVWEQPTRYTWNFLSGIELSEDRSVKDIFSLSCKFDSFVQKVCSDEEVIAELLAMKFEPRDDDFMAISTDEGGKKVKQRQLEKVWLGWHDVPTSKEFCSQAFANVAVRLYQRDPQTYNELRPLILTIDASLAQRKPAKLTAREQHMLDKAKELVSMFGFIEEIARLPITVTELGGNTLGLYEHGEIFLSPKLFDQGTKQLVATLYEECYHHRTKNQDCTYKMQSDLFNIIISLNEELHGVIC